MLQDFQRVVQGLVPTPEKNPNVISLNGSNPTIRVVLNVIGERHNQEFLKNRGKFKYTCADAEMSHAECLTVLAEEVGEVAHEVNECIGRTSGPDLARLRAELVQVAAVAVAWIEKVDKQG